MSPDPPSVWIALDQRPANAIRPSTQSRSFPTVPIGARLAQRQSFTVNQQTIFASDPLPFNFDYIARCAGLVVQGG